MTNTSRTNFALFDLICHPLVTEKTTNISAANQVTFVVKKTATKPQIKAAIEQIYKVKVKSVNTLVERGKKKVFRGRIGQQSDIKKAYIVLQPGQQIDIAAGL